MTKVIVHTVNLCPQLFIGCGEIFLSPHTRIRSL